MLPWRIAFDLSSVPLCDAGGEQPERGSSSRVGAIADDPRSCSPSQQLVTVREQTNVVRAVAVSRVAQHGLLTARASAARKRPADLSSRAMLSGLHDRLGDQADPWSGVPSHVELALSESLRSEVRHLALSRNLTDARFKTALRLFEDASSALPHRIWFLPLGGADELRNAVHNEESFGMLAEFKMRQGSLQPGHIGEPVRADTVAGYISALRVERGLGAGYLIAHSQTVRVAKYALLAYKHGEARGQGTRALRRGLRAQHLLRAVQAGFDIVSVRGMRRWARLLVAHNFLLRGGEPGAVDSRPWLPHTGMLSLESVRFFSCEELAEGGQPAAHPAIRFMILPIKDTYASRAPVPNWVRRRQPASVPRGADPLCAYDAFLLYWEACCAQVRREEWATTALFTDELGQVVATKTMRLDCRAAAMAAGLDPSEFGASSCRIGGAEDIYDLYEDRADAVIRERGRWWSDIHLIYQRASASRHLRVSAAMGESRGISLEAFADGWAMPGR